MPTKRTRQSRGRVGLITPQILEMYRRLYELAGLTRRSDNAYKLV
jgi:hypothetical protein